MNNDALSIDPSHCPNVEYILVDPSCSGSGNNFKLLKSQKRQ